MRQRAREMVDLLQNAEFPPQGFKLDRLRAPVLQPDIADAVGLRYGKLSFRAKTLFHIDQMKVELGRLRLLKSQVCGRIEDIEKNIKYVESLEVKRAAKSHILRAVRAQQQDMEHQLRRRQAAVEDPVLITDSDESEAERVGGMVRSGMGPGPDDQEPLIQSVEHAGAKNASKGKGEGVGVTENGESVHKSGEHTKVEEGMEVEVAGKTLVEDRAGGPNAIAGKSLVEDRAGGPAEVADKSSDVTVGVSGGAAKSETTIVERLETPVIFGTRVPIKT